MIQVERIEVGEAYRKVKSARAILVCGYDDESTFRTMRLEGAISLRDFESRLSTLSKEQEIIFYCS